MTIDTATDTYEQAIASVQAAYGLRPDVPAAWPDAPAADPRPGPQDLADDDLIDGWTDQLLFRLIASLVPGARAVLDVQHHLADHPTLPIPPSKIGGTLTSVKADSAGLEHCHFTSRAVRRPSRYVPLGWSDQGRHGEGFPRATTNGWAPDGLLRPPPRPVSGGCAARATPLPVSPTNGRLLLLFWDGVFARSGHVVRFLVVAVAVLVEPTLDELSDKAGGCRSGEVAEVVLQCGHGWSTRRAGLSPR
ncbi:hypothetical protein [Streptomyces sp. NPDC058294]|uniref:hypothetical protein n=1 Tax=Streptomyces sp. NPDC058294 TaxID=3346430 RepID=UPI0036E3C043